MMSLLLVFQKFQYQQLLQLLLLRQPDLLKLLVLLHLAPLCLMLIQLDHVQLGRLRPHSVILARLSLARAGGAAGLR